MKPLIKFTLPALAILGLGAGNAMAAQTMYNTDHLVVGKPYENFARQLPAEQKVALEEYLEYQQREPCQNYQPVPEGFVRVGCHLRQEPVERVVMVEPVRMERTVRRAPPPRPAVQKDYEVHFEFDEAEIEPRAAQTLDRVASEINTYNPNEVTVSGYTDTAGPQSYNIGLSQERVQSVSRALTSRGVQNQILDKAAYGENRLAVATADGVPLRENRRVEVEFRR
ncbi:MAG: OmpA family protein [Alphaproteobacteria bacterium]